MTPREVAETYVACADADWFTRYLANDKQARKQAPLARGLFGYFPNAIVHVAHVSFVANEQHNPGLPMQWAFDKSSDEPDCELRHMLDAMGAAHDPTKAVDDDGLHHLAKKAWRALADLERYLLATYPQTTPGASVTGHVPGFDFDLGQAHEARYTGRATVGGGAK